MVKIADLPEHTRPLIMKEPPEWWIRQNIRFWKEKRATYSQQLWRERVVELFHMLTATDYKEALPLRSCSVCQLEFNSVAYKMLHLGQYDHKKALAKKNGEPIPPDPLFCKHCNFRAISTKRMNGHNKEYQHVCKLAAAQNKPPPQNEKHCEVCNQTFSSVGAFRNHKNTVKHRQNLAKEEAKSIFTCGPCNKSFTTKQNLHQHYESRAHRVKVGDTQKTEKNKFCQICQKEYKTRRTYLKHCRQQHAPKIKTI